MKNYSQALSHNENGFKSVKKYHDVRDKIRLKKFLI